MRKYSVHEKVDLEFLTCLHVLRTSHKEKQMDFNMLLLPFSPELFVFSFAL
jgi:hypothetical protein